MPAKVLLTGASGYVGGRLLRLLSERSISVRCLARHPEFLSGRITSTVEVVQGDVLDRGSLSAAMAGIATAYYFVHSMGSTDDFEQRDRRAAQNFAEAAREAGVERIIYLGGLGDEEDQLSPHLRSRHEVGQVLRSTGVQVIEFRASIVLGSGSLSFEMIRALVEKLPIMITPRWVAVPAQPIAIEDLLKYLIAALQLSGSDSRVYEIGGADQVSYGELMREYARQRRLRRLLIRVPVLTPRLSSLWLGLVTPLYARIGRKLIDSIRHPTLVRDQSAMADFDIRPVGYREAIAAALRNEDREIAETRWSDAVSSSRATPTWAGVRFGNRLIDTHLEVSPESPEHAFEPIRQIGGERGWYYADRLWKLRGLLDLLIGGIGLRRGRRHPNQIRVGDTIDCWRVEAYEPDRRLRLFAEMRLPGRAWLEFEVEPTASGSQIRQTAMFDPVGLAGPTYWYLIYPLHQIVFAGMLRGIVRAGRELEDTTSEPWRPSRARQAAWLLLLVAFCFAAAGAGRAVTSASVGDWYQTLKKPSWTPPDWLFGPVWTSLYMMMAVAAWLVWRRGGWSPSRAPLSFFALQLGLNVGWSAIFFGFRSPGLAFTEILILCLAIAVTTVSFLGRSRLAALLFVPYLVWTTFAAFLNFAIWRMNT
ncbi:MAG TPA: DUF2867 domain-containing protein [Lacipirellulaceae bacterium]|nr:DUF2867 domain-containing protein [Lacipirellulaceae bacterium]